MSNPPIFAVDFEQVANAGRRTKHRATFPLRYLDHATDATLRTCALVRKHAREHHNQWNLPLYDREVRHWLRGVRFTVQPHVNLGGTEVAVGIRVDLLDALVLKDLSSAENFELSVGMFPEFFNFRLGTCTGCVRPGPTAYEVLAIINEVPGNGDFARVIHHFIALGLRHERDLLILEIANPRLYQHLLHKQQFHLIEGTPHLLLKINGPGTCPEQYLHSVSNPFIDELLEQVAGLMSQPQTI